MTRDDQIANLVKTAEALCTAVAHEQERARRLQRRLHWLGSILVALVGVAAVIGWQAGSSRTAQAENLLYRPSGTQDIGTMMAEMGKVLGFLAEPQIQEDFKVLVHASANFARAAGTSPDFAAFVGNVMTLTSRLKQDSDVMRAGLLNYYGKAGTQLDSSQASPSWALFSVYDGIRSELGFMNKNMLAMSYSMGSTMGRLGSWMP